MDLSDYSPQLFLRLRSYLEHNGREVGFHLHSCPGGATGEDKEAGVKHTAAEFSHSVVSDCLRPHALQHARPPCPSPAPGVYSNSYPSSR